MSYCSRKSVFLIAFYGFIFSLSLRANGLSCIERLGPRFTSEYSMSPVPLPNTNAILAGLYGIGLAAVVYYFVGDDGSNDGHQNPSADQDQRPETGDTNSLVPINRVFLSCALSFCQNIYLVYDRIRSRKQMAEIAFLTYGAYFHNSPMPEKTEKHFDLKLEPSEKKQGIEYFKKLSKPLVTEHGYDPRFVAQKIIDADQRGQVCDPKNGWITKSLDEIQSILIGKSLGTQRD